METLLIIMAIISLSCAAPVKWTSHAVKDTSVVPLYDSATVVKTTTTIVKNTYLDTVKLISSDTTRTIKLDTLKPLPKIKKVK